MATKKKLNTKFIALIAGVLAVALAVVGGVVLLQIRADPTRFIRSGDELMAEGRPDKAASQYLRAIGKAPSEMAYYDKTIGAIEAIQPETLVAAREEFNKLMGTSSLALGTADGGEGADEVRGYQHTNPMLDARGIAGGSGEGGEGGMQQAERPEGGTI